jgi:uncharacterized protein (TIGR03083 family)
VVDLEGLLDDLVAEGADLEAFVRDLPPDGWARPTPAEGWTVAHQVAHLAWTDEVALLAATGEARFTAVLERALADPAKADSFVDDAASEGVRMTPPTCWCAGAAAGKRWSRPCAVCRTGENCPGSVLR